jgi:hypothetical protein
VTRRLVAIPREEGDALAGPVPAEVEAEAHPVSLSLPMRASHEGTVA